MSERLSQKQIKQDIREDEVQSFLVTAIEKFQERPSFYIGIVIAVLAVGALGTGVVAYMGSRSEKASTELARAMRIYDAPIVEEDAKPDDPLAPSFASEEARKEKATTALADIGAGVAGDVAELYQAQLAIDAGDTAAARKAWEGFLGDHSGHVLAMSVRLNLLRLDRQEGKAEEVAQRLQAELDGSPKMGLPEDMVLFELAKTRQVLGQGEEAQGLFQRILDEYPTSAYAAEARRETTSG